jgi:ABC-type glutathione transport system ATPase component
VVLVTHDMEWVREYCNRAILLEKGRVIMEGPPDEVVQLHLERTAAATAAAQAEALAKGLDPAALAGARGGGGGGRRRR